MRVWFGNVPIADHVAEQALAKRYVATMRRRFDGLRVTIEPLRPHDPSTNYWPTSRPYGRSYACPVPAAGGGGASIPCVGASPAVPTFRQQSPPHDRRSR
ncbi:MAG: hypothetical protein GEU96_06585 [Propionibacteriales bacterium]|nr:hypothetical protein [Propionibacteriales bacterium]